MIKYEDRFYTGREIEMIVNRVISDTVKDMCFVNNEVTKGINKDCWEERLMNTWDKFLDQRNEEEALKAGSELLEGIFGKKDNNKSDVVNINVTLNMKDSADIDDVMNTITDRLNKYSHTRNDL